MTELVLARHGETVWHSENRYAGSTDVALTERGHRQADDLAGWAGGAGLAAVACSDLSRARDTARPAAHVAGVTLRVDPRLREVHFGDGEGRTRSEMGTRFPDALREFHSRPATRPLPDAEAGVEALRRALPALHELVGAHPGGTVLVVCHSTLLRLVLCHLLRLEVDDYRRVFPRVDNVALTTLLLPDDDPTGAAGLLGFNVAPHPEPPPPAPGTPTDPAAGTAAAITPAATTRSAP